MSTSSATHNEWLIHRELADEVHLAHEREGLLASLAEDEELLAVASAGRGFARPGILAITDRRVIHLSFRHLVRHLRVFEIPYGDVESFDVTRWRRSVEITIRRPGWRRTIHPPILGKPEDAPELATCAMRALARFNFAPDGRASLPWPVTRRGRRLRERAFA
jgi:hypothetical protein